jgi:glycosyltransferase involved in cell wall biosynthesis
VRIGVNCTELDPRAGGGYTFQRDLLEAIRAAARNSGHTFVLLSRNAAALAALAGDGVETHALVKPGSDYVRRLARLGRKSKDDGGPAWLDAAVAQAGIELVWNMAQDCLTPEAPYIFTLWDLQHRLQPFFPEVSAAGRWAKRERHFGTYLQRAALVFTGTEEGKREIMQFYGVDAARIHVLALPTPAFALRGDGGSLPPGLPERFVFYPAQFWPHKNHVNLLKAVALLESEKLGVVLTGSDYGNRRHVEAAAKALGLAGRVHFPGFVSREQLVGLYRKAVALAFVSYFGPDNVPPLEAFALGCPVIAADVPGVREQLGDAALLVDPSSPGAIAEAIRTVIHDPSAWTARKTRAAARAASWTAQDYVKSALTAVSAFGAVRANWAADYRISIPR